MLGGALSALTGVWLSLRRLRRIQTRRAFFREAGRGPGEPALDVLPSEEVGLLVYALAHGAFTALFIRKVTE